MLQGVHSTHAHAIIAKQTELAVEAGAIFVEISSGFISEEAEKFADQVMEATGLLAKKHLYYKFIQAMYMGF